MIACNVLSREGAYSRVDHFAGGSDAAFHPLVLPLFPLSVQGEDLCELSANPYAPDSTANPFGAGSPFKPDGINNPFSPYGSPFSNQSATNTFATDPPRLLDQQENGWQLMP